MASPEQLSFRERQKYFELEVRVPQAEGPPKRVSLVGADDLRKMQEEEGRCAQGWAGQAGGRPGLTLPTPTSARKLQQKRAQLMREAEDGALSLDLDGEAPDDEEPEEPPPWAGPAAR